MWYFLALAILASVGTAVLFVYLLVILFSYLAKREVLKELSKMSYSTNLDLKLTSTLP
jgi:hypothetical protein